MRVASSARTAIQLGGRRKFSSALPQKAHGRYCGYLWRAQSTAQIIANRRTVLLGAGGSVLATAQQYKVSAATAVADRPVMASNDALKKAVRAIVPQLTGERAKGQAGKIATIGGCREYTGAPYFASISALKIGADLSHVFCTEGAATVIKSYSPELIVHPYLADSHDNPHRDFEEKVKEAVDLMDHWMDRFDVIIIGPGLGRDELVHQTVKQVFRTLREKRKPVVIDADGLYITSKNLDLVRGYDLALLTPNSNEFSRLAGDLGIQLEGREAPEDALLEVTKALDGPVVVRKGAEDRICDGQRIISNGEAGSMRRAGGQGDVLSGALAVMTAWALEHAAEKGGDASFPNGLSPLMVAGYGGSLVARHAQKAAFEKHRRSMVAEDVIDELGATVDVLFDQDDNEDHRDPDVPRGGGYMDY